MILPFKPQFVSKILSGSKVHTIRKDEKNRWQVGKKIHFATGVRTKQYHCFATGVVTKIQELEMIPFQQGQVISLDGITLTVLESIWLAEKDGFDSIQDFWNFFKDSEYKKGRLIHWQLD